MYNVHVCAVPPVQSIAFPNEQRWWVPDSQLYAELFVTLKIRHFSERWSYRTILKTYMDELFFLRVVTKHLVTFNQSDRTTDLTIHKL